MINSYKNKMLNKYNSLSQWLSYIKSIHSNKFDNSLSRVLNIAKRLNLLNGLPFLITITGTNGKGSTCFFLEKCFLNSGYFTGLYTSPHVLNHNERIRVNGKNIDNDFLHTSMFEKIENIRQNVMLTYFEFITLSALLIFKRYNLDVIILEVGLGGRLDATNIIDPNIAVITNIGLDHIELLGNSKNEIGYEKSGIFRNGIPVIIGDHSIPYSVYKRSSLLKVLLYRFQYEWNYKEYKHYWNFYDALGVIEKLPIPNISIESTAIAIKVLRISSKFNISSKIIKQSINEIYVLGRFQTILNYPKVIVDVTHNPHAAKFLCIRLKRLLKDNKVKIYGILGMLVNKDIKKTISVLLNVIHYWHYSPLKTTRTSTINTIKEYLPKNTVFFSSVEESLLYLVKKIKKTDIIIVFGSFFAVSESILFMKKYYYDQYNKIIQFN